jgi:hypothetical protein
VAIHAPISISLAGFPDYSKTTAISLSVLLGTMIFDFNRLLSFRLRWFEIGEAREGRLMKLFFVIGSYRVTDPAIDCLRTLSGA